MYVGHRFREMTGKTTPSYTWKHAHTAAKEFKTRAEAQAFIDQNMQKKCRVVER